MGRRHTRQRRAPRRSQEPVDTATSSEPFDPARPFARWRGLLSTATNRGFSAPPFEPLVFGPVVHVDLDGDDPSGELLARTLDDVRRATMKHLPS
jgi:hypothetical protein